MHPQFCQVFFALQIVVLDLQDALEDLGHISQVEGIVAFAGGRQEILLNAEVDINGGFHNGETQFL